MDYSKFKIPILILIALLIPTSCIIGYLLLSGFAPFFDEECRDDLLPKVPVYPASTLVSNYDSESRPEFGTLRRVYQTSDTPEGVAEFYDKFETCFGLTHKEPDGSMVCDGRPKGDNRMSYIVRISQQEDRTVYSLDVVWHCGFLD